LFIKYLQPTMMILIREECYDYFIILSITVNYKRFKNQ